MNGRSAGGRIPICYRRNVPAGADLALIEDRDLGPMICVMLGVELTIDGRPVSAFVNQRWK
jgi:hypothetical protein